MAYISSKLEYKVVLLGPSNVGKTAIIRRIKDGTFHYETRRTTGPTPLEVKKTIEDREVTLQIWDTAGVERDRSPILTDALKQANAVGFVYDITNGKSLGDLGDFISTADEHCNAQVVKFVVGNKCEQDSRRAIYYTDLQEFADENGIGIFYEISAKSEYNINVVTDTIIKELYSSIHKVVIVGPSAVGKTKLVNMLQGSEQTITKTKVNREHGLELESHKALIIDTPGGEAHSSVTLLHQYRDADGFVFVFNYTSPPSLNTAKDWFEEIRGLRERNEHMQFMFVSNDKGERHVNDVDFHYVRVRIEEEHKDTIVRRVNFEDTDRAKQAFLELFENIKRIKSAQQIQDAMEVIDTKEVEDYKGSEAFEPVKCIIL